MAPRSLPLVVALAALAACGDQKQAPSPAASRLAPVVPAPSTGAVTVSGAVIDRDTREPVANVEVVLRGALGDLTAKSVADGSFHITVARGAYRAFVRDARVMSTGMQGRVRLRTLPRAELAGAADDKLMPLLEVDGDTTGVELTVTVGAAINGSVIEPDGKPAANVVITAVSTELPITTTTAPSVTTPIVRRTAPRPVLGTDTAITDEAGHFVLRVPAGRYVLAANHPKYAGIAGLTELHLDAGGSIDTNLTLQAGCVIAGRVVSADGKPVHDGAIETQTWDGLSFGPTDRVNPDGTFRWATTESGPVSIRAWPWHQPASPARKFECADGKTYKDVVLTLPIQQPDLAGTIRDAQGNPVPLAFIDVASLDLDQHGQQERADASGHWEVFAMPAGRYQITAAAAGRGIAAETVTSPRRDITLQLSGTGRIAGTTTELVDGSFELTFHHCGAAKAPIEVDDDPRIVVVRGGQFSVDRVPACTLTVTARWRDRLLTQAIVVEPDRTAFIELALGTGRDKQVTGTVRDDSGRIVPNARVTALVDNQEAASVRSDSDGHFTVKTLSGAQLVAGNGKRVGRATVGRANVDREQVDITLNTAVEDY